MADLSSPGSQPNVDLVADLAAAGFEEPQEIGRGGFGVVYRCLQRSLERTVAVKVLTAGLDQEALARFLREQRAMGRLSGHPNVVNIMQIGATAEGRPFIVMQFHQHGSLEVRVRKNGPLDFRSTLRVGVKVAGALETAHRADILHRDVKPANILLTEYGEPALTDFGIARISGAFQTDTGTVIATPAFTAPEILEGQTPTVTSDLYGLGATLFCALTGHAAFERRSGEQMVAQFLRMTNEPVPDLRHVGIPDRFAAAIERAMAGNPEDRPATAAEFGEELRDVERQLGVGLDEMALRVEADNSLASGPTPPTRDATRQATAMWRSTGTSTAPPAPATKFRPPQPPKAFVDRRRLTDRLRSERGRRLTVIQAPAGYGKTTLAAQWRSELEQDGVPVAWLTVDDDDNNVVWFLAHLVEAIRRVCPELANELADALEEHRDGADRFVLTSLINDVAEGGEPIAVVIDDWHRVTNSPVVAAMDFLLEHGSDNLQFIVTTRSRRGLPLSRMRIRDELVEIDSDALCFDAAEARSFLVDAASLKLADNDVKYLHSSTGGWIAALKMASLSMRGHEDPSALIGQISGRHHMIGEFLAENVLDSLEPELLNFLLRTSITEKTCGSLAGALADVARGQAMLELVEEQDLFLRRMDDDGSEWYRYQPVFAEYLHRRLDRDYPDLTPRLHHTAAHWFAEHRLLREAVGHALAAGDPAFAVRLVENDGWAMIERSQAATLHGLINKLPASMVERSPKLQIMLAFFPIERHRAAAADAALQRVVEALDTLPADDQEVANMRTEADVVRAAMLASMDRLEGVEELIAECLSRPETLPPFIVSTAADVASFVALCRGDFDAVHRWQEWARPFHQRTVGPFPSMYGYAYAGIAAYEQLDIPRAEENFEEAVRATRRFGGAPSPATPLAGALLAELRYEQGDIDEAERLLVESDELGIETGEADFLLPRYVIGARIKALRGDREAAERLLATGTDVAARMSMPRLRAAVDNERIKLGMVGPNFVMPVEYSARRSPIDGIEAITAQIEEDTSIRLLMAGSSHEQQELAYEWAMEWVARLEGSGRRRALLRAKRLAISCHAALGRAADAKQLLTSVLAQSAKFGLVRFPIDEGPTVIALVEGLSRDQKAGLWQPAWPAVPVTFLDEVVTAAR